MQPCIIRILVLAALPWGCAQIAGLGDFADAPQASGGAGGLGGAGGMGTAGTPSTGGEGGGGSGGVPVAFEHSASVRLGGATEDRGWAVAALGTANNDGAAFAIAGVNDGMITLGSSTFDPAPDRGMFAAGLDANAQVIWSEGYAASNTNFLQPRGLAYASSAQIFVTSGYVGGDTNLGAGDVTLQSVEPFVITVGPDLGLKGFDEIFAQTSNNGFDSATAVGVAATGEIYIGGRFANTLTLDTLMLTGDDVENAFVAQLSSTGTLDWALGFAELGPARVHDLIVVDDTLYICGSFEGSIDFGLGRAYVSTLEASFVAEVERASGTIHDVAFVAGSEAVRLTALTQTPDGDIVVGGLFEGGLTDPQNTDEQLPFGGGEDGIVLVLDAQTLAPTWARAFGAEGIDHVRDVAVLDDIIVVGGIFQLTTSFGGDTFQTDDTDVFLVALDVATGEHRGSIAFPGASNDQLRAISRMGTAADPQVVLVGDFQGTVDFGGDPLVSQGDSDVFVAIFDVR